MSVRAAGLALKSRERNAELLLLGGAAIFILLAWRTFERLDFEPPGGFARVALQFALSAAAGHLALRLVAPYASGVLYAAIMMLAAIGMAFVTRLAPEVAADQANWVSIGVVAMVASAALGRHYRVLRRYRYTAAAGALAVLIITGVFGTTINGARLWISIAGQEVQTTEIIKLLVIVFLAGYLADEAAVLSMPRFRLGGRSYSALPYLVPLLAGLGATIAALALIRDLGSVALLLLLAVGMLFVATGRAVFLIGGAAVLLAASALGYLAFDHAHERINTWLDPYEDPGGSGYQSLQALYALQAGGVTGEGLGQGQPEVIPAASTDYVFSAVGEELGLAGAMGVASLYIVLLYAGFAVAARAPDAHGRLLATAIALLITLQAGVIILGNLRVIPTTGITLPFVSYGGSSLVVNFVLVGGLLALSDAGARRGSSAGISGRETAR